MTIKPAVYCRISDDRIPDDVPDERVEDFIGLGVRRQLEDCLKQVDTRGWGGVVTEHRFIDNDVSAFDRRKKRPEYRRLLRAIRDGSVNAVVCWHVDRLWRQPRELEDFLDLADETGAELDSCYGRYDLSTEDGIFMARLMVSLASKESADKSRRVRRKKTELAEAGKLLAGGTRPFGYESDRKTIRPAEADLVREAARKVLAGVPLSTICREWNDRGVPTATGRFWHATILRKLLNGGRIAAICEHTVYDRQLKKRVLASAVPTKEWPAIIDPRTHRRLRELFSDGARRQWDGQSASKNFLRGYAFCECEARLIARSSSGVRYYRCQRHVNGQPHGCGKTSARADDLEEAVLGQLYTRWSDLGAPGGSQVNVGVEFETLQDAVERAETKRRDWVRMYQADEITHDEFQEGRVAILERVAQAKRALANAEIQTRPTGIDWLALMKLADTASLSDPEQFAEARMLLEGMVKRVMLAVGRGDVVRRVIVEWRQG